MKPLDFLIIGAQKCATTALNEHLRNHPRIVMPLEKEVPFFTERDCSAQAWEPFAARQFGDDSQQQLWGKASPQYMCDPGAPSRIKALMPDVKLIAILRDPIDRTLSHFRMGQRRQTEQRDFAAAVRPLLDATTKPGMGQRAIPDHADGYQSEADYYVAWSEYGRALARFTECFAPGQLLVLYTEDLESHPQETLDRLLAFIGLPEGFRPTSLGKVVHRGGSAMRIPQSLRDWLKRRRLLYRLWQRLPEAQQGRLRFKYEQWNVRRKSVEAAVPDEVSQALRAHFRSDLRQLMALPVPAPPWADRYFSSQS